MANVCFPAETVCGPLVVVISRISDTFGISSRFASLETVFISVLVTGSKGDFDQSFSPFVPQCPIKWEEGS